ncbi:MAG: hypothetical protein U0X76_07230 [Bacteroidia bacterium]
MRTTFIKILFSTLAIFLISSCKKNEVNKGFPYVAVSKTIYLTVYPYTTLNSIGNNVLIDGVGYKGIVIYRRSLDEFVAYDRACPYDPYTGDAILDVDSSSVAMIDYHCQSKFNLYDGSILHGPATAPMKSYRVDYSQVSQTLYITN